MRVIQWRETPRPLTLDEKITLKGLITGHKAFSGALPRLTMQDALYYFPMLYGKSAGHYAKVM